MFVAADDKEKIHLKRRERFTKELLSDLLNEADKLGLTTGDIIDMITQLRKD